MSILVDEGVRLMVQGVTSRRGSVYVERMLAVGTEVVAGIAFGQGGTWLSSVPLFDTVREAVHATNANVSLVCVPAQEAMDAVLEAADAGISPIVCTTSGIPVHDMVSLKAYLRGRPVRLIGPGSPGVFSPGKCIVGAIPEYILQPGAVGVVSRSGSLAYEVTWRLTQAGFGQSTILGIGGGLIVGTGFVEILGMFEDDPLTEQVVVLGEIGGQEEESAATFVADEMTKPVVAFVTGQTAPPGRQMGHAGAIIREFSGTAQRKIDAFERAGGRVARALAEIPSLLERS